MPRPRPAASPVLVAAKLLLMAAARESQGMFLRKARDRIVCGVLLFMVFFQRISMCVPIHTCTGQLSQKGRERNQERLPVGLSWGRPATVYSGALASEPRVRTIKTQTLTQREGKERERGEMKP